MAFRCCLVCTCPPSLHCTPAPTNTPTHTTCLPVNLQDRVLLPLGTLSLSLSFPGAEAPELISLCCPRSSDMSGCFDETAVMPLVPLPKERDLCRGPGRAGPRRKGEGISSARLFGGSGSAGRLCTKMERTLMFTNAGDPREAVLQGTEGKVSQAKRSSKAKKEKFLRGQEGDPLQGHSQLHDSRH